MIRPGEIRNPMTRGVAALVVGISLSAALLEIPPLFFADSVLKVVISNAVTLHVFWILSTRKEHDASWAGRSVAIFSLSLGLIMALAFLADTGAYLSKPFLLLIADGCCKACGLRMFAEARIDYRRERIANGGCVSCCYDLTGNESGTCPECGTEIEKT